MTDKNSSAKAALTAICKQCSKHDVLQQEVEFNYKNIHEKVNTSNKEIDKLNEIIIQLKDDVSKKIPIIHFIAIVGAVLTILSFLIGLQVSSNKETDKRMIELIKEVTATKVLIEQHVVRNIQFDTLINEIKMINKDERDKE